MLAVMVTRGLLETAIWLTRVVVRVILIVMGIIIHHKVQLVLIMVTLVINILFGKRTFLLL